MSNQPKRPGMVHIPRTALRQQIDETTALKRAMLKQLSELEQQATGRPVTKPGTWRHDPSGWAEQNLRDRST